MVAARHTTATCPEFEHAALLYDGPSGLATELGPDLAAGIATGHAVLVCVPEPDWQALAATLGPSADAVTYLPPAERYDRPGVAMATLHRFVDGSVAAGAPVVWSIGAIPYDGTADDRRWLRYEHAVEAILGDRPLRAVCAYDTRTTAPDLLESVRLAHDHHAAPPQPAARPQTAPLLELTLEDAASARRALGAAFACTLGEERRGDLLLVATELVTNAVRHGAPPVELRAWEVDGAAVVEVLDHGPGVADAYPDLRPNRGTAAGGYGWWLVGQLADAVDIGRAGGRTSVRVVMRP